MYIGSTTGDERSSGNPANGSTPTMMANSHRFVDVAHIGIHLGIGNHHYTICINSCWHVPHKNEANVQWSENPKVHQ